MIQLHRFIIWGRGQPKILSLQIQPTVNIENDRWLSYYACTVDFPEYRHTRARLSQDPAIEGFFEIKEA